MEADGSTIELQRFCLGRVCVFGSPNAPVMA
jgi:hypothetical protein